VTGQTHTDKAFLAVIESHEANDAA